MVQAAGFSIEGIRIMADSENKLKVGPDSFREMTALVIDGRLASCESCVGFYYFQSEINCRIYLDSCADAGLVVKVSLLQLKAEADLDVPAARKWYDQPIYISSPRFRKLNLDFARRKVENTANAVYNAYFIYHELLGANDNAISAAYENAVEERQLRNFEAALARRDVSLSAIAKLRLILDGFKNQESKKNKKLPEAERLRSSQVEKRATDRTVDYILQFVDSPPPSVEGKSDRGEELDKFITDFLINPFRLKEFLNEKSRELPAGFHVQLLLLISELCRRRYAYLAKTDRSQANNFIREIRSAVDRAKDIHFDDHDYLAALSNFAENLNSEQLPALPFSSAIVLGSTLKSISL